MTGHSDLEQPQVAITPVADQTCGTGRGRIAEVAQPGRQPRPLLPTHRQGERTGMHPVVGMGREV